MFFLPIVQRELRAASRRKNTHRVRLWAGIASVVVFFFFIPTSNSGAGLFLQAGPSLFRLLTWYVFALALMSGIILSADCISEEKRDGTLGLLFLTDLKGYDIVMGKLAAVGLTALFGLVAVLPVTGVPLILGGVTIADYCRESLALVNALFFALATGICISTFSRRSSAAFSGTIWLVLLIAAVLPLFGAILSKLPLISGVWVMAALSPTWAVKSGYGAAYLATPEHYWISLAVSHAFAWGLLMLASRALPNSWQERALDKPGTQVAKSSNNIVPTFSGPTAEQMKLEGQNPVLWLVKNERATLWVWILSGLFISVTTFLLMMHDRFFSLGVAAMVCCAFAVSLKLLMAFFAPRFIAESRRNGALELLACTPMTSKDLIAGQWMLLKRTLLWPAIALWLLQMAVLVATPFWTTTRFGLLPMFSLAAALPSGTNFSFGSSWVVPVVDGLVRWALDMFALGWMGMWLGLSTKNPRWTPAKLIFFVMVLPLFFFFVPMSGVVFDTYYIFYARERLFEDFRGNLVLRYQQAA